MLIPLLHAREGRTTGLLRILLVLWGSRYNMQFPLYPPALYSDSSFIILSNPLADTICQWYDDRVARVRPRPCHIPPLHATGFCQYRQKFAPLPPHRARAILVTGRLQAMIDIYQVWLSAGILAMRRVT